MNHPCFLFIRVFFVLISTVLVAMENEADKSFVADKLTKKTGKSEYVQGMYWKQNNNHSKAEHYFKLSKKEGYLHSYRALAILALENEKYQEALDHSRVAFNKGWTDLAVAVAVSLGKLGQTEEALIWSNYSSELYHNWIDYQSKSTDEHNWNDDTRLTITNLAQLSDTLRAKFTVTLISKGLYNESYYKMTQFPVQHHTNIKKSKIDNYNSLETGKENIDPEKVKQDKKRISYMQMAVDSAGKQSSKAAISDNSCVSRIKKKFFISQAACK